MNFSPEHEDELWQPALVREGAARHCQARQTPTPSHWILKMKTPQAFRLLCFLRPSQPHGSTDITYTEKIEQPENRKGPKPNLNLSWLDCIDVGSTSHGIQFSSRLHVDFN